MVTTWTLTFDSADPRALAAFWALALGYAERPPPDGFESWDAWSCHHGVPEEEWHDGAFLHDPDAALPRMSFLKVPESKVAKNRLHLDIQAGGGRETPWQTRWPRVLAKVEALTAAGATMIQQYDGPNGQGDHILMTDPEGNEFCVL